MLADQFHTEQTYAAKHCAAAFPHQALGYSVFEVGLNNQKMALLGLFHKAREMGLPVVLPQLALFNPARGIHGRAEVDLVYPVEILHRFARAYGITILDSAPIETIGSFDCFTHGSGLITAAGSQGMIALEDFTGQFFRGLRPRLGQSPKLQRLKDEIFRARQVKLIVQLRIEKDWAAYTERTLNAILDAREDYKPSFMEIFGKITKTLPEHGSAAYIVCDESDLPVSKDEIRAAVQERFGINPVWKSDVLGSHDLDDLSLLEQSAVDFEMAVEAPGFIGMSRSTFANMACFESFCRRGAIPRQHFIYNLPGERLGRRCDTGSALSPGAVCDPLPARMPLAPPHHADVALPMVLLAHIASYGDFTTQSAKPGGAYAGPLCCGYRRGGGQRLIEGISITSLVPDLGIAYRVLSKDGHWTDWLGQGAFAGTRGLGQQVFGLSLRLTGPLSLSYSCHVVGSFAGQAEIVRAEAGQDCVAETMLPLEALQVIFRRI